MRPRIGPLVIGEGDGRPTVLRLYDDHGGCRDLALDRGQLAKLLQSVVAAYLRETAREESDVA